MKNLVHRILRHPWGLAGLHPKYEDLLAYRDRELGRLGRWRVENHLRGCPACQREAAFIEEDLRTFERMDHLYCAGDFLNVPKGLGKLRKAIEDWEVQNLYEDKAHEPERTLRESGLRQLETEFDLYLGNRATAGFFLKMGSAEGKHTGILVEAESVLGDFLGPSAASAVMQRVLRVQTLMDTSIQGSLPA